MGLTAYIVVAMLANVNAGEYELQCSEKQANSSDSSSISVKDDVIEIGEDLTFDADIGAQIELFDGPHNPCLDGGNICRHLVDSPYDGLLKAMRNILQIGDSDCPIAAQSREHSKELNVTLNCDETFHEDTVDIYITIYQSNPNNTWVNMQYSCTYEEKNEETDEENNEEKESK